VFIERAHSRGTTCGDFATLLQVLHEVAAVCLTHDLFRVLMQSGTCDRTTECEWTGGGDRGSGRGCSHDGEPLISSE